MIVEKLQLSQADVDQAVKDIKKNLQQSKYADMPSLSRLVNGYLKLTTGGFS
jgi:transcriptional regulator NrdR family protein